MAFFPAPKDRFSQRLKELEKEARVLRADIRKVARAVSQPGEPGPLPALKSRHFDPPPASPLAAPSAELAAFTMPGRDAPPPDTEALVAGGDGIVRGLDKGRFINYFATGSFIPTRVVRQERNLQRNKAIFMLVVVVVVAFIVIKLVFF